MNHMDRYLAELQKKIPDIEGRLNAGAGEEQLEQLARKAGCGLPAELLELYRRFDGEDMAGNTGFFAGLQFLSLEKMLSDFSFFRGVEDEMTAMGTKAIQEEPVSGLCWLPIAYDCARAWLVMDLSPAEEGKAGQIITLDYDMDRCYLLADSLDDLFAKMTAWLRQGILIVDAESFEEPILMERTGHLFNSLEELTAPETAEPAPGIPLPGDFWTQRYGQPEVPLSRLEKEKTMLIQDQNIDCTLFARMGNLKELILHRCRLVNAGGIAQAPQLKKLIFVECTFDGEQLSVLSQAPCLKELGLNVMSGKELLKLKDIKSLRRLQLRKVYDLEPEELSAFRGLWELSMEAEGKHDGTFLGKLKKLKKLDLHRSAMNNLDFLKDLAGLTEFCLAEPAENEDGLSAVRALPRLKEFVYPVKDLSIYKGHPTLESIGMAAGAAHGFEALEGTRVNQFTVIGKVTDGELQEIKMHTEKYVRLRAYGSRSV